MLTRYAKSCFAVVLLLILGTAVSAQITSYKLEDSLGRKSAAPSSIDSQLFAGSYMVTHLLEALDSIQQNSTLGIPRQSRGTGKDYTKLYQKCAPSVVLIQAHGGFGAGVVVSDDGKIVTNWHVVRGLKDVNVYLFDTSFSKMGDLTEEYVFHGQVKAVNIKRDLALVQLVYKKDLPAIKIAPINSIAVGQPVFAIGHPLGLIWSITTGIVSQLRNSHNWEFFDGIRHEANIVQTEAAISPGNSGGPLLDSKGRLTGINSTMQGRGLGLNFAVSGSEVLDFLNGVESGKITENPLPELSILMTSEIDVHLFDNNKDGITDLRAMDCNGDGEYDFWMIDADQDGKADYFAIDRNHDGIFDVTIYDLNSDGIYEKWVIDRNYDGIPDTEGWDVDGDGIPDFFK